MLYEEARLSRLVLMVMVIGDDGTRTEVKSAFCPFTVALFVCERARCNVCVRVGGFIGRLRPG